MDSAENMAFMEATSDTELLSAEPTPTPKRRRKKSFVWDYFTVEAVSGGCTRACCKQCKQSYAYSTGSKIAGTSHLKRHILMGICPMIRQEKKQLTLTSDSKTGGITDPPKRRYRSSSVFSNAFDQERSCADLAKMIIMHEYPLHMVEHPAFAAFVQALQPRFKMPNLNAIEGEIMAVYQKEKQNLSALFGIMPGRVSLTIGLWTTSQTLGYVGLTGHFIDHDWKLHKRMLNFMMVSSPHSENALSDVIGYSLSDWNMKTKLFTITLDNNCSSHDIYSANLRDHLSNKNTLMLKGQLFVVRCFAHILNLVAQDVIASIHGIVYNIRESVKYVKASLAREEKFVEIAQQLQIPSTKTLSLDVQMQWNTTYLMLVGALDFRHAFACLETCDPDYNEAPSTDDWKKVEIVCTYLKLLYDSANTIMGTVDPTSNLYFQEAWKIQLELTNATLHEDSTVSSIAKEMHEKFDKYWKDCSLVLAVAVVMDPRFKMKLVEFSFTKIYGEDAARYIKMVDDAIHELYTEYVAQPLPLTPAYMEHQVEAHSVENNVESINMETIKMETNYVEANNAEVNNDGTNNFEENNVEANIEPGNLEVGDVDVGNLEVGNVETGNVEVGNVEAGNAEVCNVDAGNVEVGNAEVGNVDAGNAEAGNVDAGNVEAGNHEAGNVEAGNLEAGNPEVSNVDAMVVEMKEVETINTGNSGGGHTRLPATLSTGDGLLDFDIYISETAVNNQTKSELDQYLEESLVPRIQEFDILNWWKLNILKYPTLCKMARDILGIPMSMVSSFSTGSGSRLLDEYRSSLRPDTVEALFCTKDWLQYVPTMTEAPSNAIVKMEF